MQQLLTSGIVNRIAEFTSQRDVGRLESSLLKSVNELFESEWSALYRVDMQGGAEGAEFSTAVRGEEVLDAPIIAAFPDLISTPA